MDQQHTLFHLSLQEAGDHPGTLIKTYQTQGTRGGRWLFIGSLFVLVVVAVALVYTIIFIDIPMFTNPFYRPSLVDMMGIVAFPFISLMMIFIFFAKLSEDGRFVTPLNRKIAVSLYTNGLIYRKSRKQQVVTWEQVSNVERGMIRPWIRALPQYQVHLENGSKFILPRTITQIDELGKAIERAMINRLFPQMLEDYEANKTIVFPGLCLTQEAIGKSDESLPWSEVARISFDVEALSIEEKGHGKYWLTAPLVQFCNVCVLEALVARIREEYGFE